MVSEEKDTLWILTLLLVVHHSRQGIIDGPSNTVYWRTRDQTGLVNCILQTQVTGTVFLTSPKQIVYSNTPGFRVNTTKYDVPGTDGNYSLVIKNLVREDSGVYKCQYNSEPAVEATVTVADPPGDPVITLEGSSDIVEGRNAKFRCISTGGYPDPQIVWMKGGQALSLAGHEVTITPTYADDKELIECRLIHVLVNKTATYDLNVKYKPRVSLKVVGGYELTVQRGHAFNVSCQVQANPDPTSVTWLKNGESVVNSDMTLYVADGIGDETTYRCTVTNSQGETSDSAVVNVHYAPEVSIEQGEEKAINVGEQLTLTCRATARPNIIAYSWTKDGRELVSKSAKLVLTVDRSSARTYECKATNTILNGQSVSGTKSIQVHVNYAPSVPTISVSPKKSSGVYRAGERVTLTCNLALRGEGYPAVSYIWYHAGVEINAANEMSLVIEDSSYSDSGEYRCRVSNSAGGETSQALSVAIHDIPAFLSSTPEYRNFTKGDKLRSMDCVFRGIPPPHITWYHNDQPLSSGDRYTISEKIEHRGFYDTTSTLQFRGSTRDGIDVFDTGLYSCKAKSDVGESNTIGNFTVDVLLSPEIRGYGKSAGELGMEVKLNCEVDSYPAVTAITFLRDGKPMTSSIPYRVSAVESNINGAAYRQRGTVTFHSLAATDYGSYTCKAGNAQSEAERELVLQRPSEPDPPTNITVIGKSWNHIIIQWIPRFDGGKTQSFVVSVDGKPRQAIADSNEKIKDLYPNTEYTVDVMAKNILGESSPSKAILIRTDSLSMPSPKVSYNQASETLTVVLNSTDFCVIVMGGVDSAEDIPLFGGKCFVVNEKKEFAMAEPFYTHYKAKACVAVKNDHVCGQSTKTDQVIRADNLKYIIIAIVLGIVLVIVLVAVVAVLITRRRRERSKLTAKSISPPLNNGYVNHIMIGGTDEIDTEPPYATYVPPNNNLNMTTTFNNLLTTAANPDQAEQAPQSQNLDYIYAAVQKKSAEQSKSLSGYGSGQQHHMPSQGGNGYELWSVPSTPPTDSNSDNTEQDTLDEMPVFPKDQALSVIIGSSPPQYKRLSNVSESGYSTPDSRVKKVIYEVIV